MHILQHSVDYQVGYIVYKRGARFGPRTQTGLQLMYLYEGEAWIRIAGKTAHLESGQACLLHPGRDEFFQFSRTSVTRHGWCTWENPTVSEPGRHALEELPFSVPFSPRMRELARMARPLNHESAHAVTGLKIALGNALLWEFFRLAGLDPSDTPPPPRPVERALAFITERYREDIDLSRIAEMAGITGAHLIRLFKQHLQTTPERVVWRVRVDAGLRLLRDTGLTASEIAYACGFKTPYHFSRLVKGRTGLPPGAYRRDHWQRREPASVGHAGPDNPTSPS